MATKGIIFSAPMVRALLDERKTQTRRLISAAIGTDFHRQSDERHYFGFNETREDGQCGVHLPSLPYAPGDRLYVRESALYWVRTSDNMRVKVAAFRADGYELEKGERWTPSIHMPRWASRLWLNVTDVRVQRLQDINQADAIAEGAKPIAMMPHGPQGNPSDTWLCYRSGFEALWNSLHTKPGETWDDNPWIVAVSFAVKRGNVDA
jgi:hypothetical protein